MLLESFEGGPVDTIGYLLADRRGGTAVVIDAPLATASAIVEQARRWETRIAHLLITHPHWDHFLDNAELLRLSGATLGLHREGLSMLELPQLRMFGLDEEMPGCKADFFLEEGKPMLVGDLTLEILHCPGHCPGSVALFEPSEKLLFTGDVLFAGSVGRADLPGGDMETLLRSIREKLLPLGDEVRVLAGHGSETTLGEERRRNPFLVGRERFWP
ncbi:MAG: MBL fold metallo-hydrolase [Verrucomicrobia bacterium]|nr:MBL fold metallo-hydrolase [Verrucomicrobiota bacterium]